MWDKLLDGIKDSYVQRFAVATILTGVVAYMTVTNQPIPDAVLTTWLFVLGYGVGIVSERAIAKAKGK